MHIIVDTQSDARSGERRWTFESLPAEIAFEDRHCERVWSSRRPCRTAIDVKTGAVLWKHLVSAPAVALPAIYIYKGKQYVPFAAGGNSVLTPRVPTSWSRSASPERGRWRRYAKSRAPRWRAEVGAMRRHGAAEVRSRMPPSKQRGATC